jgi:hypothetical protein
LLGADAPAGATNIKVNNVANISPGDKIRLDIDSVGHGIETVTVTKVGTPSSRTALAADAGAGATNIKLRGGRGGGPQAGSALATGNKLIVGTPANHETVTITAVGSDAASIDFTPALAKAHVNGELVIEPGTGLDLAAPLKFSHAGNLPFSDRGTGISFKPAAAFAHSSNEPVQALGAGVKLDSPLVKDHAVDAVVRDAAVTNAGYQGSPAPNQWFGGPAMSPAAGNMVLREAAGLVVDSLNYGLMVDPWAAEGYQAVSGTGQGGCRAPAPGPAGGRGPFNAAAAENNRSVGRFPDGADQDSNCGDFMLQPATTLPTGAAAGAANIKVANAADFAAGQTIAIDTGANMENAVIATVGGGGATTAGGSTEVGATSIALGSPTGFIAGQTITIDSGANAETAVVVALAGGRGGARVTVAAPLTLAHAAGAQISGSGITLSAALTKAHANGAQVASDLPTPGAPNKYSRARR